MTPVSSSCSSASLETVLEVGRDGAGFLRGLAEEGVEAVRLRPSFAAPLVLRDLVMRDECAGVIWNDMVSVWLSCLEIWALGELVQDVEQEWTKKG